MLHKRWTKPLVMVVIMSMMLSFVPLQVQQVQGEEGLNEAVTVQSAVYEDDELFDMPGLTGMMSEPNVLFAPYAHGVVLSWAYPQWSDYSWTLLRDDAQVSTGWAAGPSYYDNDVEPDTAYTYTLILTNAVTDEQVTVEREVQTLAAGEGIRTEMVSLDHTGSAVDKVSSEPSLSADGQVIAFTSEVETMVEDDTNVRADVFVRESDTGVIERISVASDGTEADYGGGQPSISGDGNRVAFVSSSTNLHAYPSSFANQIYIRHRDIGHTEIVTVGVDDSLGDYASNKPAMSADGRYVVYQSQATNLIAEDSGPASRMNIFLYDRVEQTTEWVSRAFAGGAPDGNSENPAISDDGRYVVFESMARNLVDGGSSDDKHIFVWEREAGEIQQVSKLPDGRELSVSLGDANNSKPDMSGDGKTVVFYTEHETYLGTTGPSLQLWDRDTGELQTVNYRSNLTSEAILPSAGIAAKISADGSRVLFASEDPYMTPPTNESNGLQLYLREMESGKVWHVSASSDGVPQEGSIIYGSPLSNWAINQDGTHVVFQSNANNLTDDRDSGNIQNVFLTVLEQAASPPSWPAGAQLEIADSGQTFVELSWGAAQGDVDRYWIYQDGLVIDESASTSYRVTGLEPGRAYAFAVAAEGGGELTSTLEVQAQTDDAVVGDAGLTVNVEEGGLAHLTWDQAADVEGYVGYRIERRVSGAEDWEERGDPVELDVTEVTDQELLGDTAYEYRIMLIPDDGPLQQHTRIVEVHTPALYADEFFWSLAEEPFRGYAAQGSSLTFIVTGEPQRSATVVVTYNSSFDDDGVLVEQLQEREVEVELAEDESGIYRGEWDIPAGAVQLHALHASITDGEHVAELPEQEIAVSVLGDLEVSLSAADGVAFTDIPDDARMRLWSEQVQSGSIVEVDEEGTYAFSNLLPADDYLLRLDRRSGGMPLDELDSLVVRSGLLNPHEGELELEYKGAPSIQLEVRAGSELGERLGDVAVSVTDADTGRLLGRVVTDANETVEVFRTWDSSSHAQAQRLQLRLAPTSTLGHQYAAIEQIVEIQPGEQLVSLVLHDTAPAVLQGRVLDASGEPIARQEVVATGIGYTSTAVTDEDGYYTLSVYAGEVEVSAVRRANAIQRDRSEVRELDVQAGESYTGIDLTLSATYRYSFAIGSIRYERADGTEQVYMNLGRSEAANLQFTIESDGMFPMRASREGVYPLERHLTLEQYTSGMTATACIDGRSMGFPPTCQEIEVDGSESQVYVDFVVELPADAGVLLANPLWPNGQEAYGEFQLFDYNEQLRARAYSDTNGLYMDVPEAGEYWLRSQSSYAADGQLANRKPHYINEHIFVGAGEIVDLGNLDYKAGGRFGFQSGNSLTAESSELLPGTSGRFRLDYANQGEGAVDNTEVEVHLPEGMSLVAGSVLLNQEAVAVHSTGSSFTIALGNVEADEAGVVHFQLEAAEDAASGIAPVPAVIRYEEDGASLEEWMGSLDVHIGTVSIIVPRTVHEPTLTVQGQAPADSRVRVMIDGIAAGEAQAAPNGYWKATVELSEQEEPYWFLVEAEATHDGERWEATPTEVLYEPSMPRLLQVDMRQRAEPEDIQFRDIPQELIPASTDWSSFRTEGGVARFARTMLAGLPFEFRLHFNEPTEVTNVTVHVEGPAGGTAQAYYDEEEQIWRALMPTERNASWVAGKIWVDFDHQYKTPSSLTRTMVSGDEARALIDEMPDWDDPRWMRLAPSDGSTEATEEEQLEQEDTTAEDSDDGEGALHVAMEDYYRADGDISGRVEVSVQTVESWVEPEQTAYRLLGNVVSGSGDVSAIGPIPEVDNAPPWNRLEVRITRPAEDEIGVIMRGEVDPSYFIDHNETAPEWHDEPELILSGTDASSVTLQWSPAQDDVWVESYEIQHMTAGGDMAALTVPADEQAATIGGLTEGQTYTFQVIAVDPGDMRTPGPEITVTVGDQSEVTTTAEQEQFAKRSAKLAEPKWKHEVRIAAEEGKRVKLGIKTMEKGIGVLDLWNLAKGGVDFDNDMQKLTDLLDNVEACAGSVPPDMQQAVDEATLAQVAKAAVSSGFYVGGALAGSTGVGLVGTAALTAIGLASDFAMDYAVNQKMEEAEKAASDAMEESEDCEKPDEPDDPDKPEEPDNPDQPHDPDMPKGSPVADPSWKIDPSGYVYEVSEDNRIEGVTATLLFSDVDSVEEPADSTFEVWDGEWWGEENPLLSNSAGWYGWDVPRGWWRVIYEKEGYETTYSQDTYGPIEVPPPHFEVNVPMKSYEPPQIEQVDAALDGEAVEVQFNRHIRMDSIGEHTAQLWTTGEEPERVEGEWVAIDAVTNPHNDAVEEQVAQTIQFVPAESLVMGDEYRLFISELVQSYAEVSLVEEYDALIVVEVKPEESPDPDEGVPNEGDPGEEPGEGDPGEGDPNEDDPGDGDPGDSDPGDSNPGSGGSGPIYPNPVNPKPSADEQSDTEQVVTTEDGIVNLDDGRITIHLPDWSDQLDVTAMKWQVEQVDQPQSLLSDAFTPLNYNMKLQLWGQRDEDAEWQPIDVMPSSVVMEIDLSAYEIEVASADKSSLYLYDARSRSWQHMMGRYDEESGTLTVILDRIGTFSLLEADVSFADIDGHWAQGPIERLAGYGMISGRSDTAFDPNTPINRAEFTALLVRMLDLNTDGANRSQFDDVGTEHWFAEEVAAAVNNEVIFGVTEHTFEPFRAITRQEMATMIVRTLNQLGMNTQLEESEGTEAIERFSDYDQLAAWAKADMSWLVNQGLVTGRSETAIAPRASLTRAEAAIMLTGLLDTWLEHHMNESDLGR